MIDYNFKSELIDMAKKAEKGRLEAIENEKTRKIKEYLKNDFPQSELREVLYRVAQGGSFEVLVLLNEVEIWSLKELGFFIDKSSEAQQRLACKKMEDGVVNGYYEFCWSCFVSWREKE